MPRHAGVIWKGDKLIDGVPETLDMLRAMGKRLVFVTNNSTKSRKQYAKKFYSLGLNVAEEEIFASSFAAAAYLKSVNFPSNKKVEFNWSSHKLASVILEALKMVTRKSSWHQIKLWIMTIM
jgi:HAD superfamily hydrolase (TIGR01450 family)